MLGKLADLLNWLLIVRESMKAVQREDCGAIFAPYSLDSAYELEI